MYSHAPPQLLFSTFNGLFNLFVFDYPFWPHRHKTYEYFQGNSPLKYLSQKMMELEISSTLITFSDFSMYRLRKFSTPPFTDLDNSQLHHSQT
jgi:hypothetical protein